MIDMYKHLTFHLSCRNLIANSLRKKHFYKEAIRVELIPSSELDLNEPWSGNGFKWDPISGSEGDLILDDMAKSFSAAGKVSKTVKAIDFASIVGSMPSQGLQLKDYLSETKPVLQPVDDVRKCLPVDGKIWPLVPTDERSNQPRELKLFPQTEQTSSYNIPSECETSGHEDLKTLLRPTDTSKTDIYFKEIKACTSNSEDEPISNGLINFSPDRTEMDNLQSEKCASGSEATIVLPDGGSTLCSAVMDIECDAICNADSDAKFEVPTQTRDVNLSVLQNEEARDGNCVDVVLGKQNVTVDEVLAATDMQNETSLTSASNNVLLHEYSLEKESRELRVDAVLLCDGTPSLEFNNELKRKDDSSVPNYELLDEMIMEDQKQADAPEIDCPSISGTSSNPFSQDWIICKLYVDVAVP